VTRMGATSDHSPRIAPALRKGLDVLDAVRESSTSPCGELDAMASTCVGVPFGALSRTQTSQPEVKDGLGLGLWVSSAA
jgi:hypothetical protein